MRVQQLALGVAGGLPPDRAVDLEPALVLAVGDQDVPPLVVQVDGHAYHSSAADRGRDAVHDAELRLRGYHVLRFTYSQVLHDWPAVERSIARAVAAGLHRSQ